MNSKESGSGKKSSVLLGAFAALGLSGDSDPGLKSKHGLDDGLGDTKAAVTRVVDMRESDPHDILDSLKGSYPELAAANQDAALLEVIEALGNDLLDFLNNFGPQALLILALIYIKRRKDEGMISLDDHPDVKTKLGPQLAEARNLVAELDDFVDKPIDAKQSDVLCVRVAAVTSGILLTLAPLTAEASLGDIGRGVKDVYDGTTHGLGGLLQTIGQIAESLSYISYVIDLAVLLGIIGLGFKNSEVIGKAYRGIKNNKICAGRARYSVIGPRMVDKKGIATDGIATRLIARPGNAPGDIAAQTAGKALHAAVTGITPANAKSIIQRLMSGEIDVGHFREEIHPMCQEADEILGILAVDYTNPANVFPTARFDAHVARFNTLVAGLNSRLHNIPKSEREIKFKDIAAMIIMVSSLILGVGWYKAHYFGVNSGSGSSGVSAPSAPSPNIPDIPLPLPPLSPDPHLPSGDGPQPVSIDGPEAVPNQVSVPDDSKTNKRQMEGEKKDSVPSLQKNLDEGQL